MEVARAVARRMEEIGVGIPPWLVNLLERREFWEYIFGNKRKVSSKDFLSLKNRANRSLFIRVAAYGLVRMAQKSDQEVLSRLSSHSYRLIARAAAIRVVRIAGAEGLRPLALPAEEAIKRGDAEALAGALRDAEMEHFGLAKLW